MANFIYCDITSTVIQGFGVGSPGIADVEGSAAELDPERDLQEITSSMLQIKFEILISKMSIISEFKCTLFTLSVIYEFNRMLFWHLFFFMSKVKNCHLKAKKI